MELLMRQIDRGTFAGMVTVPILVAAALTTFALLSGFGGRLIAWREDLTGERARPAGGSTGATPSICPQSPEVFR